MICWNLDALVNGFNFSLVRFLCRWFLLWEPCDFDRSRLDDRLSRLVFRYTWRDPSSCSRLKSSTGAALSSGEMKVKLICLGQWPIPTSQTNLSVHGFSFAFYGKAKKRTQSGKSATILPQVVDPDSKVDTITIQVVYNDSR